MFLPFPPSLTPPDELQQLIWGGPNHICIQTSHQEPVCDVQRSQMSFKRSLGLFFGTCRQFISPLPSQATQTSPACLTITFSPDELQALVWAFFFTSTVHFYGPIVPPPLPSQSARTSGKCSSGFLCTSSLPFTPPHTISSGSYLTSYDPPAGIDRSDNSVISRWIGLDIYVSQVSLLCSFSYFC